MASDDTQSRKDYIISWYGSQLDKGRYLGATSEGSTYAFYSDDKSWSVEFRPFGSYDYGYLDDRMILEWPLFLLQAGVIIKEQGWKRAAILHVLGFLDTEFLLPLWREHSIGSNYITNIQTGWLLYHGLLRKDKWSRRVGFAGVGWNAILALAENSVGFDWGDIVAHDVRATGIGSGVTIAFIVSLMTKLK
jgi:hypothetical protein